MSLISRYVIRQLSVFTAYALLALLSLYAFFDILSEIGKVGQGQYSSGKMLQFVLLQMPSHAYELMPLAVLIGGLIALSQLASNSEYTVIKTSGISTARIIGMLLLFGGLFALLTALLGEWVMPKAEQQAERLRLNAIQGVVSSGGSGLWFKENQSFIHVREMMPDNTLRGITLYRYDDDHRLLEATTAATAAFSGGQQWQLHDVASTLIGEQKTEVKKVPTQLWQAQIDPQLLNVLLVDPEQMSASSLKSYIQHLHNNNQQTQRYEIAWWRKLFYPIAAVAMALIALAFTPQQRRHGNMGLKLFVGICLGIGFHFANRLFGFSSQLYDIPPVLAATLPTVLFFIAAVWWIRRQEVR